MYDCLDVRTLDEKDIIEYHQCMCIDFGDCNEEGEVMEEKVIIDFMCLMIFLEIFAFFALCRYCMMFLYHCYKS